MLKSPFILHDTYFHSILSNYHVQLKTFIFVSLETTNHLGDAAPFFASEFKP